ncbi:hypothetical protein EON63_14350 [archaeon]|nr:MAG: hypothetical protein EON63_14350 [archaeon]
MNGQALGNSLYGLQNMHSKEPEVRSLLQVSMTVNTCPYRIISYQILHKHHTHHISIYHIKVLASKVARTWEDLKAQEIGNALYGLKRMSSEVPEVRQVGDDPYPCTYPCTYPSIPIPIPMRYPRFSLPLSRRSPSPPTPWMPKRSATVCMGCRTCAAAIPRCWHW